MAPRWLLAAIVLADISDAAIPDCAIKGVSYSDPHVLTMNGGQPDDALTCQKTCAFTTTCMHFTYFNDSKGCWLLTADAKLREKGFMPSEIFAVSGPKHCPEKKNISVASVASATLHPLHPDEEGHVTIAPGVEIGPTGPRPVPPSFNLGAEFQNVSHHEDDYIEIPYLRAHVPRKLFGISWIWCVVVATALAFVCLWALCCLCCTSSSPRKRKRAAKEVVRASAAAEEEPLVRPLKDAGLFRPQLHVPQLPLPQLVTPQLISVPASQANVRSMELHVSPIMSPVISPRASPRGSPRV